MTDKPSAPAARLVFLLDSEASPFPGFEASSYIWRDGDLLVSGDRHVRLPATRLRLAETIIAGSLAQWSPVLAFLTEELGPDRLLVFVADDPLRDLGLLGQAQNLFSFGVMVLQTPARVSAKDYAVFSSASLMLFSSAAVEARFKTLYVPWYNGVTVGEDAAQLPTALRFADQLKMPQPRQTAAPSGPRILLVAYFSGPARTVGVLRMNYWHDQLPKLWPGASVTFATATPWDRPDASMRYVPDLEAACLVEPNGQPLPWAAAFLETQSSDAKSIPVLSSCWRIGLERHFDQTDDQFDIVIISGNPFSVFDFASYAKRKWSARVILDYRDPFGNNPRMAFTEEARKLARYTEKGYNLQADLVTVVNDDCVPLVEARDDVQIAVIPNGYDERKIPPTLPRQSELDGKIHFVHAGTIFHDRSPKALIQALDPKQHRLHHIGRLAGIDQEDQEAAAVELHGSLPYDETMENLSQADCGIVFVSETGFETPTKLYDYLAYGLDILIVSHGPLEAGAAAATLRGLSGVFWVKNTPEDISAFIKSYRPSKSRRAESFTAAFSRRSGTELLLDRIAELTGQDRARIFV